MREAEALRWAEHALCKGKTDLFYSHNVDDQARARIICEECPVRLPCDEYGAMERWGVWGGAVRDRPVRRRKAS